jgi:hypothetical protein
MRPVLQAMRECHSLNEKLQTNIFAPIAGSYYLQGFLDDFLLLGEE